MNDGGKWLSKPAVLWAMDDAPGVPDRLVSTLLVVARYADEAGRGAYPSAPTVALGTRKSTRQAQRDLAALEERGLLVRGNQALVKGIRADRRPVVYDLPMPRHDNCDAPSKGHGTTPGAPRHDTSSLNGTTPVSYKEVLKTSGKRGARASGAAAPRASAKPPWCGECSNERERQVDVDGQPGRCPVCHPLGAAYAPARGRHAVRQAP